MKKLLIFFLLLSTFAHAQRKVLMEAGERRQLADTNDTKSTTAFAWWGDSFTANGTAPAVLGTLMGLYSYNGGVGGETSTQIKTRFLADTVKWAWPTLIWSGRNNSSDSATVVSDIVEMVSKLGHTRYLIISVFNAGGEPSGSSPYINIQKINSSLAAIYGGKFVDARSYIVSQYNPSIPADVANNAQNIPPKSLRATNDSLHLNETGYRKVAQYIYDNYRDTLISNANKILTIGTNKIGGAPALLSGIQIQPGKNLPAIRFFNNQWQPNNTPIFIDMKVGTQSLFFGYRSGLVAPENQDNYGIGYNTMASMSGGTSYQNIAFGSNALSGITTGSHDNIAIGTNTGNSLTANAADGIYLGNNAGNNGAQKNNCSNCLALGLNAYANRNNQAILGGQSLGETLLQGQVGVNMAMVQPKTNVQFQINSLTRGFMPPRMTAAQRLAITMFTGDSATTVWDKDSSRQMEYSGAAWRGLRYTNESAVSSAGRYTPTATAGINVASITTTYSAHYRHTANEIEVTGVVTVSCTASATSSIVTLTLPNGWLHGNTYGDAEGVATAADLSTRASGFVSTNTTSTVAVTFTSVAAGQNDIHYKFTFTKTN